MMRYYYYRRNNLQKGDSDIMYFNKILYYGILKLNVFDFFSTSI